MSQILLSFTLKQILTNSIDLSTMALDLYLRTVSRFGPHTLWEIACSLYASWKEAFESGMDAKLIIQSKREGFFFHKYLDWLHTVTHFAIHSLYKELQN